MENRKRNVQIIVRVTDGETAISNVLRDAVTTLQIPPAPSDVTALTLLPNQFIL